MTKVFRLIMSALICVLLINTMDSCKPKAGHNKYREAKVRPSEHQLHAEKKQIKRGEKNYQKQMRSNRKRLFGSKTDPGASKRPGK